MVTEGAQVVVGDTVPDDALSEQPATAYEVLCRDHHRRGVTRAVAQTGRTDPLPFEREDEAL
jgi:thymidine kinase